MIENVAVTTIISGSRSHLFHRDSTSLLSRSFEASRFVSVFQIDRALWHTSSTLCNEGLSRLQLFILVTPIWLPSLGNGTALFVPIYRSQVSKSDHLFLALIISSCASLSIANPSMSNSPVMYAFKRQFIIIVILPRTLQYTGFILILFNFMCNAYATCALSLFLVSIFMEIERLILGFKPYKHMYDYFF